MKSLIKEDADSLAVATNVSEDMQSDLAKKFDENLIKDLQQIWNNISSDYWNVYKNCAKYKDKQAIIVLKKGIKGDEVATAVDSFVDSDLPERSKSIWQRLKPGDKNHYLQKAFPTNKTYVA